MKDMGIYDLIYDEYNNKCPICKEYVETEKCGFSGCEYKCIGINSKPGTKPEKISMDWIEVGDYYKVKYKIINYI